MDGLILLLILLCAIRGWFRGAVVQGMTAIGVIIGLWAGLWAWQWVGHHWGDARPAVVFGALRVLVTALVAIAAASVLQVIGGLWREALRTTPLAFADRAMGVVLGTGLGLVYSALLLLALVHTPWPPHAGRAVAAARTSGPIFEGSIELCRMGEHRVLGATWFHERFSWAARRTAT